MRSRPDGSTIEVGLTHCPACQPLKPANVQVSGDVPKRTYLCGMRGLQINRRHDGTRETRRCGVLPLDADVVRPAAHPGVLSSAP
jgi:hypothetical protein